MEVNNNLLDTEEELMEEDLEEEDLDEDEYDFNDEDDPDEEDVDPDEEDAGGEVDEDVDEDDEDDVDGVDEDDEETPAAEDEGSDGVVQKPDAADAQDPTREKMQELLSALGYTGPLEEAMAAYEADKGARAEGAATPAQSVDYNEMARNDLRDINAAFGLDYADFSSFDDLKRFAELRTSGATALEAFRATQKQFQTQDGAKGASEPTVSKPSKDHLKSLPHSGGGESGKSGPSQDEIRALREVYPELSKKELGKVLDRVKRRRH